MSFPWLCETHATEGTTAFVADCGCYERMIEWLSEHLSSLDECPRCGGLISEDWKDAMELGGIITTDLWHSGTDTFIGCDDCHYEVQQEEEEAFWRSQKEAEE
jgi:Zn-finger nucleic acid-binding protein